MRATDWSTPSISAAYDGLAGCRARRLRAVLREQVGASLGVVDREVRGELADEGEERLVLAAVDEVERRVGLGVGDVLVGADEGVELGVGHPVAVRRDVLVDVLLRVVLARTGRGSARPSR